MTDRRPLRLAGIILAAGLLSSACGAGSASDGDTDAQAAATDPSEASTTSSASNDSEVDVDRAGGDLPVPRLAYDAGELSPTSTPQIRQTTTSTATTAPPETSAGPATTTGSGGAPVTTLAGGGGGDVSIYQGVLGALGRDESVVAPAAPAPVAAAGMLPLTGLPGSVPQRPAAVVKVDNGSKARPQTGLNAADIVVEEEVEGGITRLAVIFHSTPSIVGPVRSGRTTDIGIINGLGDPLLLYSGANDVTDALILAQPTVQNRSAARSSGYWRSSARRAPSNLYTDTAPHWASATGGPPPAQFAYRADGAPVGGVADDAFTVAYRASSASWSWDGSAWLRSQGGAAHLTASGQRVSAANVVVVETDEVATGMVDSSGATVPEFIFVGSGPATVFTAGMRIEGTWTRPTLASAATLTTGAGTVIELTPGRTWIEVVRAGGGLLR